ncbi:methylmalonyl-CoA mutase family protein [Pseudomonadota bacterium]
MSTKGMPIRKSKFETAKDNWQTDYLKALPEEQNIQNRSGIEIKPIYSPLDWDSDRYMTDLGFPAQVPMTRGIYATMYRSRSWSQRQLIGLGCPDDYNKRTKTLIDSGANALSLIPCNSVYRGYDMDEVDVELLGTCGTVINSSDDMDVALKDISIGNLSTALNDPSPFTLLAMMLAVAKRRGIDWKKISGTSNQSDYISHYVANHMFYRLSLSGSRRVLLDHIEFCMQHVPNWNPLSIVGQHMQQAGATPAEAMALTLCTAIQYANDLIERGLQPDDFLHRFTFFFDISISFFEEVAKFRAGRRLWTEITRNRFNAKNPRSWRFKFHSQTSGVDLTRQQPLNNISRVAVQAMAGIFGGTQSMHTDSYDEVLSTPTEAASRIAVNTQNILREEADLDKVIDPLAGSYYMETLTNEMAAKIETIVADIDAAGGMYQAVEKGIVQAMLGDSALAFQKKVEQGDRKIVGVNAYQSELEENTLPEVERPDQDKMTAHVERHKLYKVARSKQQVAMAVDRMKTACHAKNENIFAAVVKAAEDGVTHGEICACLREELGFGQPLIVA